MAGDSGDNALALVGFLSFAVLYGSVLLCVARRGR